MDMILQSFLHWHNQLKLLSFIKYLLIKPTQLLTTGQLLNSVFTFTSIRLILAQFHSKQLLKTFFMHILASSSFCVRFHPSVNINCHASIKRTIPTFKNINIPLLLHYIIMLPVCQSFKISLATLSELTSPPFFKRFFFFPIISINSSASSNLIL